MTVLVIAGLDPSGGAGLVADLAVLAAHGARGMGVVTAITAQNRRRVDRVEPVPADLLRAQLDAALADRPVAAVKIGMLGSGANARQVALALAELPSRPPIVLDPVLFATVGPSLLADGDLDAVRDLAALATLVTPNRSEAAALAGSRSIEHWLADARALVTGGDSPVAGEIVDELWDDGRVQGRWTKPRIGRRAFHGTGCALSSAIAARLARGEALVPAVGRAIDWVRDLIVRADATTRSPGETAVLDPLGAPA